MTETPAPSPDPNAGSSPPPETPRPRASLLSARLKANLQVIYPEHDIAALTAKVLDAFWPEGSRPRSQARRVATSLWSERDTVLITYGDSFIDGEHPPLTLLHDFLKRHVGKAINGVHILPFFPYTSDDGFSVVDYRQVNSALGTWDYIERIGAEYRLMADLVLNHVSSHSAWFSDYLQGNAPGSGFFVEADPDTDTSAVVRPRAGPLLRKVETASGEKHVWCTFSPDQVDLNFANPEVLLEFLRILRFHIDHGVRTVRLDAVAFIWKQLGTACINLPQAHEIVRLMRTLVDYADEKVVLITETNVPIHENLSYFGNRNEAHAVYNFSLPPLMLHALLTGTSVHLNAWQMAMPPAQLGCAFLNFVASHDGIGLRPAEGLLDDNEIDAMIDAVRGFGGLVSLRSLNGGGARPYEINVSLFDALKGTADGGADAYQRVRFLCAQTVMMALEGIPAFYVHSLLATPNDLARVEKTQANRAINRHQWDYPELNALLEDPASPQSVVLAEMTRRIAIRTRQPAFHPNATQFTLQLGHALFGFWRQSMDRSQSIFVIANMTDQAQELPLISLNLISGDAWCDLLSGNDLPDIRSSLRLEPYQCVWISNRR
ncbi:alpha-amylase family glycosyl hydrolase [Breoghania sp. L-A4]|uniref:alpha-amylase family glycosyl hydrolase n=1 Tax=Breoghania sp. L-A4 TaxID=2304600 RepID=UPI0020C0575D|nr:alpha-amylase family glycosyl hydrolase [Breoghania sp. L-A4]